MIVVICHSFLCHSAMLANFPSRCTVLAKKQLLYAGAFGPGSWLCGLIFIDRVNREQAVSTMHAAMKRVLALNVSYG